ncbi:hypothetical protein GF343_00690 [Candidatus Woesearchaeota archaeon]|nr:hypothetical protein [Candidatus Woesearchaeota archaeon]
MDLKVEEKSGAPVIDLALDTISKNKQALVFVNTKRSAEKSAEEISKKIKNVNLTDISEKAKKALSRPTKQCERLAKCLKAGIAFHHAGLHSKQKELIEAGFREGRIKIICCTPTLCVSKDTKIWHGASETLVSDFKKSNPLYVLSGDKLASLKLQKIEKIHNSSKLIHISSVSGHSIKITPNHKMLIKKKNKKVLIKAENIKKSDKIATIGNLSTDNVSIPANSCFIRDNEIKNSFKFTPDLSYFIGLLLGDGYSGAETNSGKIKYKGSPSIVGIDAEVFSHVKKICRQLELNCRKTKTFHGTPQLVLGKNNWFREFLVRCGVEHRDKKHISENLMMMDLKNISSLLRGLFDTDGYVNKQKNVGFSNISEKLVKQMQKLLLRIRIVSSIRKRKAGVMKIYEKEYKTKPHFELLITQKKSILDFYRFVGFNIQRKQDDLIDLVAKLCANLNYVSCGKCNYKIYADLFSGRTKAHKNWGKTKLQVIKLLGKKGELGSRKLNKLLEQNAGKSERRLNHHYELIKKRRIGNRSNTELFWSLNPIGKWVFDNILSKNRRITDFFRLRKCPLCQNNIDWLLKRGWRDSDFEGDIFWDKIREIREVDAEKFVYDVVLPNKPENDHLFVADGFIIHNSAGVDLPAFRAIIRDVTRFTNRGMQPIPVLEYLQMAGRAGRPSFDRHGEAIVTTGSDAEKNSVYEKFVLGEPEDIFSKLAVEPVLRTYLLSLISTRVIQSKEEIYDFFGRTFWAYQFKDMDKLMKNINKMLKLLEKWTFIQFLDNKYKATLLGRRIAELYIDPLTANHFLECLQRAKEVKLKPLSLLLLVCNTLEMWPLLRVKVKEYDLIQEAIAKQETHMIDKEPNMFEPEYDSYLNAFKTALMLDDWIKENDDVYLLEHYDVRPGETRAKLERANWLLYALYEIARIDQQQWLLKDITKLRFRLKHGAKEELIPLLRLKNVGRMRARKMFKNGIKDLGAVRKAKLEVLEGLLGKKIAQDIKEQVGEKIESKSDRGQLNNFVQ